MSDHLRRALRRVVYVDVAGVETTVVGKDPEVTAPSSVESLLADWRHGVGPRCARVRSAEGNEMTFTPDTAFCFKQSNDSCLGNGTDGVVLSRRFEGYGIEA